MSVSPVNLKFITVQSNTLYAQRFHVWRQAKQKSEKKLSTSWFFLPRETKLPYPVRRHSDEQTGEFTDTSFHYSSDEPEIPFHPGLLSVKTTQDFVLLFLFFF